MKLTKASGVVIAGAVAAMFASACGDEGKTKADSNGTQSQAVRCYGINECAGMGECANPGQGNSCEGLNECAGMGWVSVDSEAACTDAGGQVLS